jgi:hypothetical protein
MVSVLELDAYRTLEDRNLDQRINPMETALTATIDEVDDLSAALAQLVAMDRSGAIDTAALAAHNAALAKLRRFLGSVAYELSLSLPETE